MVKDADQARSRSRASMKFDILDGLCADRRVTASEFRVAFATLQFLGDLGLFPSVAAIAAAAGVSSRTVQQRHRSLAAKGWMSSEPSATGSTNRFRFYVPTPERPLPEGVKPVKPRYRPKGRTLGVKTSSPLDKLEGVKTFSPPDHAEGVKTSSPGGVKTSSPHGVKTSSPKHLKGIPEVEYLQPGRDDGGYLGAGLGSKAKAVVPPDFDRLAGRK